MVAALASAEDIVAVEGVDMVLIGTNDLLADLGLAGQYDHAKVHEAYERTIADVSTGTDLAFLVAECGRRARQVKDLKI
jgi:2-keto-3-deoxy-L-rhamnonate aldolase RhmA